MEAASKVFCDLILELGRKEKKLEVIRQVLCEIPDFEPYSAFRRLDRLHKNSLDEGDLHAFFQDNRVDFSQSFVRDSLLQHYDLDGDGKLLYAEFLRCLLPADHPTLRTIVSQRPILDSEIHRLPEEIEYTLGKLLTEEVNVYIETEGRKRELAKLLNSDFDSLFLDIDEGHSGYIDFNNLMDFLQKNGIFPYEEEVIYILRRLDKDDDGRISLLELQNEVSPKESLGFLGGPSANKTNLSQYENALGKNLKSSASKNYPFEAIRRSASPMKGQILKSPIKEPLLAASGSKVRSHRKDYSNNNNQLESQINRDYSQYVRQEVNIKEKETNIYESPKKRLEFESVTSLNKYTNYNPNGSPSLYTRKEPTPTLNNLKSEIEREMGYSKKSLEYKDLKSEVERELNSSKYRGTPPKTTEKEAFSSNNNYQSLGKKPTGTAISEAVLLEIAQFLKGLIRSEREVQYLRGDLSLRPDYNISELFSCLDKLNKGYLNPEEIEEFFEAFDVFSSQEKNAFLGRFCKTKEILNFADFVNAFQGNQETIENISASSKKRQSFRKGVRDVFSVETFSIIKEIVRTLVKNERVIEENSKELLRRNPVDLKEVFASIDVNKNGVLSEFEIKRFLEKNDIYFNDKDIKNLLDRIDRNKRRSISLNEFFNLFHC